MLFRSHARVTPELTRQREAELNSSSKGKSDDVTDNRRKTDNLVLGLSPPEENTPKFTKEEAAPSALAEKLTKKMSAGDVISDFVHSDNPKFAGKSKKKRKEMALAAYYSKQREKKSVNEEVSAILEEIRDNLQEQFVYIYENYDESVMEQFLASLTMEEAYLLGINEETEEESVKAAAAEKENPKPSMDVGGGLPPPAAPTTGWTPKVTPASPEVKR